MSLKTWFLGKNWYQIEFFHNNMYFLQHFLKHSTVIFHLIDGEG